MINVAIVGYGNLGRRVKKALEGRDGETRDFSKKEMHKRIVYVTVSERADRDKIKKEIIEMPDYYSDYNTELIFINREEMKKKHSTFPRGGFVLTAGIIGIDDKQVLEYRCQLQSNPVFTGSVFVTYAHAAFKLQQQGITGASTMLDIPPALLSSHSSDLLRRHFI